MLNPFIFPFCTLSSIWQSFIPIIVPYINASSPFSTPIMCFPPPLSPHDTEPQICSQRLFNWCVRGCVFVWKCLEGLSVLYKCKYIYMFSSLVCSPPYCSFQWISFSQKNAHNNRRPISVWIRFRNLSIATLRCGLQVTGDWIADLWSHNHIIKKKLISTWCRWNASRLSGFMVSHFQSCFFLSIPSILSSAFPIALQLHYSAVRFYGS